MLPQPQDPLADGPIFESGNSLGFESQIEFDGALETRLLAHYRDTVCHYMMPTVDRARNPWLRIYSALAIDGKSTPCQSALRQALVSVSAYHLDQTRDSFDPQPRLQAETYRLRASHTIQTLSETELTHLDQLDKQSLLAAAMALISTDVFGADCTDCTVHLSNARRVISSTGNEDFWQSDGLSSALWQIFSCYHLVTSTALVQSANPRQSSTGGHAHWQVSVDANSPGSTATGSARTELRLLGSPSPIPPDALYILGVCFGVAEITFSLLYRTVQLAEKSGQYRTASMWPHKLTDEVHALQRTLISEKVYSNVLKNGRTAEVAIPGVEEQLLLTSDTTIRQSEFLHSLHPVISEEVLRNHQECFHYALLLYFYRAFPEQPFSSADTVEPVLQKQSDAGKCQFYVSKILDCLETIESLTGTLPVKPANTLWPAFIAAAEAVDVSSRHRALIWLTRMALRGLGNVVRAKEMVKEIWRQVDRAWCPTSVSSLDRRGLGPVDWRTVMAEQGSFIMLT